MFPVLLEALWQSPDPDEALNQFERFLAAAGPRTAYLELLAERPDLLVNLVKLCARGELLTQLLVTQPELLNSLADPATFAAPRRRADFRRALAQGLGPHLSLSTLSRPRSSASPGGCSWASRTPSASRAR